MSTSSPLTSPHSPISPTEEPEPSGPASPETGSSREPHPGELERSLRDWIRDRREWRANRRGLNHERSGRRVGEGQEIGCAGVGTGAKSERHAGTPGGG
jgi:hypothetical protein